MFPEIWQNLAQKKKGQSNYLSQIPLNTTNCVTLTQRHSKEFDPQINYISESIDGPDKHSITIRIVRKIRHMDKSY